MLILLSTEFHPKTIGMVDVHWVCWSLRPEQPEARQSGFRSSSASLSFNTHRLRLSSFDFWYLSCSNCHHTLSMSLHQSQNWSIIWLDPECLDCKTLSQLQVYMQLTWWLIQQSIAGSLFWHLSIQVQLNILFGSQKQEDFFSHFGFSCVSLSGNMEVVVQGALIVHYVRVLDYEPWWNLVGEL